MKKFYSSLSYILIIMAVASNSLNAQVARQYVILEQSANTSMPVCSYFVPITSDIESAVANATVAIYHDMDYFYTPKGSARLQEMFGTGDDEYPAFWVDGERIPYMDAISGLQSAVEARNAVQSNFSIDLSETHTGSNYTATVVLTKEADFTNTNMVMRLILKEKNIYYDWTGWEGETVEIVDNVVRDMIPTEAGSPVNLTSATTQTFNLNFTIDSEWDKDNCELIAYIQDTDTEEVLQAVNLSLQEILSQYDAELYSVEAPKESVCDNTISPTIYIMNKGGENLTDLTIEYLVDSETPMTYNWTGNLPFNERTEVILPEYTFTQDYNTLKTFSFTSSNPNGETDENTSNDAISSSFTQTMYSSNQLFFELKTDDYGSDTSWELINSSDDIVASGDGYSNTTIYNETIDITATDCYTFSVYDAYGDGISSPGYYTLKDENDNLIAENGFFNSEESTEFNIDYTQAVNTISEENLISVYPNPSSGSININNTFNASLIIYDIIGKNIYEDKQCSSNNLKVSNLDKGSYILLVSKDNIQKTFKIVVLK